MAAGAPATGARVRIYADLLSQPSRAVLLFCKAAGINHEFKPTRIQGLMHKHPEYKKINPFLTVPCMVDVPLVIRDSAAIYRYLCATRDVADHWYPKDLVSQARVDEFLHWHHLNTRLAPVRFFQTKWVLPMMTDKPAKPEAVARWEAEMVKQLRTLETVWLAGGENKFVTGLDEISVADIQVACEIEQPTLGGYPLREKHPILAGYLERVRRRLHPHYDEVHAQLWRLEKKFPDGRVPSRLYVIKEFLKAKLGY